MSRINYRNLTRLWSKLTITSGIQLLCLIALVIFIPFVSQSFATYGWQYIIKDLDMPLIDQSIRIGLMFTVAITSSIIIYTIYLNIKLYSVNKYLIYTFGIFNWCLFPWYLCANKELKFLSSFRTYLGTESPDKWQISHHHVLSVIQRISRADKLFWNTILSYVTLLSTIVGMALIIAWYAISADAANVMMQFFVYFTVISNEMLFIYMLCFMFWHKKIIFRQNTLLIYMSAYIFIVMLVFWAYLFPQMEVINNNVLGVQNIWLHGVSPIIFIIFCINSFCQNYVAPKQSWHKMMLKGLIVPWTYALYAYSLPFVTHFSVYGPLTNLNPETVNSNGEHMGGLIWLFGFLILVLIFLIYISMFWLINYYIVKTHNKRTHQPLPVISW